MLSLEHILFSGIAIYQELQSSHAINEGPCAYLVGHLCRCIGIASVYFELTQLVRALVRLQ